MGPSAAPKIAVTDLRGGEDVAGAGAQPPPAVGRPAGPARGSGLQGQVPIPRAVPEREGAAGEVPLGSSSIWSHICSTAAAAEQSRARARSMSPLSQRRIRASTWADRVAQNTAARPHPPQVALQVLPPAAAGRRTGAPLSASSAMSKALQAQRGRAAAHTARPHSSTRACSSGPAWLGGVPM